jgi:LmbE family N-acetylglucosaminyl deacetylase
MVNERVIRKRGTHSPILIVSPHPDDECILGSIALRLQWENKCPIFVLPATYGSQYTQRARRLDELQAACKTLNWSLYNRSLTKNFSMLELKKILEKLKPVAIVTYHPRDNHPTHSKISQIVLDCLKQNNITSTLFLGEYWSTLRRPNLSVELSIKNRSQLIKGLKNHKEEIKRNPYHLSLESWWNDSSRRGRELLKISAKSFGEVTHTALYECYEVHNKRLKRKKSQHISLQHDLGELLPILDL